MPYLTSVEVTSRLTGLENMTPFLIFTVTVLPSSEISGMSVGEVRHRLELLGGRIGVEAAVDRVDDPDGVRVVRLLRIHVVDITAGEDGQLAALLGALVGVLRCCRARCRRRAAR